MPYILGDDARKIDWKSTAKTGQAHVKIFYEEKEVNISVCALMSGSLLFENKKASLLEVCAQIGFQTLKSRHLFTPIMITQDQTLSLPSSKKQHAVTHFIKQCDAQKLQNTRLKESDISLQISRHLRKKSFVILVGDFLGDFDFSLLAKRHVLHLIMIRSDFEQNPVALGEDLFIDPESGESAEFYFGKSAQTAYSLRYHDNDFKLFKHLKSLGITYQTIIS